MTDTSNDLSTKKGQIAEKEDLKEKVVAAYNALALVRVSTVISNVDLESTDEKGRLKIVVKELVNERSIITQSDLVEGDIVTIISPELETNTELRKFHSEQVTAAVQVLPDNLSALVDLFDRVVKIIGTATAESD